MLDIYWRLHSQQEQIFIPYDLEISLQELDYIRLKAEQWRGEDGARRKVAVYDYVWEEEEVRQLTSRPYQYHQYLYFYCDNPSTPYVCCNVLSM